MKLFEVVEAYKAVKELMQSEWDYASAYKLVTIKRQLEPNAEFYDAEEFELVSKYGDKDEQGKVIIDGAGRFTVSADVRADFFAARNELREVAVIDDITPITVKPPQMIRPALIEALEGFVTFEEGEDA